GRRARALDVPQADHRAAAHGRRARAHAPDGRGDRRDRGHDRACRGGAAVKALSPAFQPYRWAPTTIDLARRAGIDPVELVRFNGNVPPLPLPSSRPATVAAALATVNEYPRALYSALTDAIAQ